MAGNPALSITDGVGDASNVSDGGTINVTPGNVVVAALQSSTGIQRWILREDGIQVFGGSGGPVFSNAIGKGFSYTATAGGTFSASLQLPYQDCLINLYSSVWDGYTESHNRITLLSFQRQIGLFHRVRGVVNSNVSTAACSTTQDGLTLANGDRVLLVAQTTASQNGIWVAGSITGGNATLTRPPDFTNGLIQPSPIVVSVEAGTSYGGQMWQSNQTGNITVGTTSVNFFPKFIRGQVALSGGAANVTSLFINSGAYSVATCNNASNVVRARTPTAGVGTGFALFDGTLTDTVSYLVINFAG